MKMQTTATARKVKAAAAGGGVGVAAGEVLVYAIESIFTIDIPGGIEASIVVIVAALLAWASGYWARPALNDRIQAE